MLRRSAQATAGLVITSSLAPLFAGQGQRRFKLGACDWSINRMGDPGAFAAVDTVARALKANRVVELADAERARAAAYLITMVEGAALHLERLRTRASDFDPDVRDRLIAGAMLPGVWVAQAQKFRRRFREQALALFREVDIVLAPATPCRAPNSRCRSATNWPSGFFSSAMTFASRSELRMPSRSGRKRP